MRRLHGFIGGLVGADTLIDNSNECSRPGTDGRPGALKRPFQSALDPFQQARPICDTLYVATISAWSSVSMSATRAAINVKQQRFRAQNASRKMT